MALAPGFRLGPYEVRGVIGAGGMGEVYRAHDPRLHRDVAIKVLPLAMATNPRRMRRFEREARALAALRHPNIATVYAVEDVPWPAPDYPGGSGDHVVRAMVMEFIRGDDLSLRIRRGPLPLPEAVAVARQVAEALAAAHDAGIVHRDLKPANIKVREDGSVTVLDFGLAKYGEPEPGDGVEDTSATRAEPSAEAETPSVPGDLARTITWGPELTQDGAVVGTAAYMAPEQARGQTVDTRADIWAFGVLLFEMLSGRRPFSHDDRDDSSDVLEKVLTAEPAWDCLPHDTPAALRRLIARCLAKDRRLRLHHIADARFELEEAALATPAETAPTAPPGVTGWWRTGAIALAGAAAGAILVAGLALAPHEVPIVTHARIGVEPADELHSGGVRPSLALAAGGARTALAWLPTGRHLAFIGARNGERQIFVRDLSREEARPIAGTTGALTLTVSPEGDEIAFLTPRGIYKVRVAGGPATELWSLRNAHEVSGLSWGQSRVVFTVQGELWEAPSAGGPARRISELQGLVRLGTPHLLPDGETVLFTEYRRQWTSGNTQILARRLTPGSSSTVVLDNAADPRYLPTGHLAFLRQGTLFIVAFDLASLAVRGEPVSVVTNISQATVAWDSLDLTMAGQFAISPEGALAYVKAATPDVPTRELIAIDRQGIASSLGAPLRAYRSAIAVSPDGASIAVSVQSPTELHPYAFHLGRRTLARLAESVPGEILVAAWSAADRLALTVIDQGRVASTVLSPAAAPRGLEVSNSNDFWASSLSPQHRLAGMRNGDIWVYPLDEPGRPPGPLWSTPTAETQPVWSPDGRWLAYTSSVTGRPEIYLREYPGEGVGAMVSADGGFGPAWSPDGRELFYIEPGEARERMMVVNYPTALRPSRPRELFSFARDTMFGGTSVQTPITVSHDGRRFYGVRTVPTPRTPVREVHLILNWFEELAAAQPVRRQAPEQSSDRRQTKTNR